MLGMRSLAALPCAGNEGCIGRRERAGEERRVPRERQKAGQGEPLHHLDVAAPPLPDQACT